MNQYSEKYVDQLEVQIAEQQAEIEALKAKRLTDEEIMDEAEKSCLTAWVAINPMFNIDSQKETAKKRIIDFARAILRKAQEK